MSNFGTEPVSPIFGFLALALNWSNEEVLRQCATNPVDIAQRSRKQGAAQILFALTQLVRTNPLYFFLFLKHMIHKTAMPDSSGGFSSFLIVAWFKIHLEIKQIRIKRATFARR